MDTYFEQWLQQEKKWMADYRNLILKRMVKKTLPATAVILGLLMGAMGFVGGGDMQEALLMAASGVFAGAFITLLIVLFMLPGLRTGRMEKGIRKNIKEHSLTKEETEQLGREMLAAAKDPRCHLDFVMSGPGSSDTPASFMASEHYAYLRGGYPLVNLVRLSDCGQIRQDEERKTMTQNNGRTRRIYHYTLYTIAFFFHSHTGSDDDLADAAMGFFSRNVRDEAYAMLMR